MNRPQPQPVIDAELVTTLIADQFPQWSDLPVTQVVPGGWDNRTFRLGDELSVRLPSNESYVLQVEKEQRWLPVLAKQLSMPVPVPVGSGRPSERFPFPWSVYRWLPGDVASADLIARDTAFAVDLARFLSELQRVDASDGPLPGAHNFFRGDSPAVYDEEARQAISALGDTIDAAVVSEIWDAALATRWDAEPVWFHGDVSEGNLLVEGGRLAAVIDFGTSGVGDPACDLVIALTTFRGEAREAFRAGRGLDEATWARARGWAIWKALIVAAGMAGSHSPDSEARKARRTIDAVIEDHLTFG